MIYRIDEADAQTFATQKHSGQFRRGGDPYIAHPERVAGHVRRVKGTSKNISDIESAAWLHDTLEDTDTSYEELVKEYGENIAKMVYELTSDKQQAKAQGKTKYLQQKLKGMSNYALVIKLADRLDNVSDLMTTDNVEWAKKYAYQTLDIIEYLTDVRELTSTQNRLVQEILSIVNEALAVLE